MLPGIIKKIFKIQLIFIYIVITIFFCTIFFKRASNNLIQKLDTEMLLLQMDPKSIVADCDSADIFSENPTDFESIALKLRSDYQASTYFDAPLKLIQYMFLQQQFFFFDFDKGYVLFAVDYLSILVLFAAVAHYAGIKSKR